MWEPHLIRTIAYFVKKGSCCIDVGANAGFHTICMAACSGDAGRIFAFEPNSLTFPRLVDNINLNPQLKDRITAEKLGLSNRREMLKLFQSGPGNAYVASELNPDLWTEGGEDDFELCLVLPLDEYLKNGQVDFMKIDVEGMELEVLQGAERILRENKPVVVFETLLEAFDNEKIKNTETFLRSLGYVLFALNPEIWKLIPTIFPALPEDTIAIHQDRIGNYFDMMLNTAEFEISMENSSPHLPATNLTIVGYDQSRFSVLLNRNDSDSATNYLAKRDGDDLVFTAAWNGEESSFRLHLFQDEPGAGKINREQFTGTIVSANKQFSLTGRKLSGELFDYATYRTTILWQPPDGQ